MTFLTKQAMLLRRTVLVAGGMVAAWSLAACIDTSNSSFYDHGLNKVEVRNATALGAVCADGSPGAYYFRKGSGAGINHWVILVQGGNHCSTASECDSKLVYQTDSMSSLYWAPQVLKDGILSDQYAENPDFYDANHVLLKQCSNDSFLGNKPRSVATFNYSFVGDTIFRQIIADLTTGIQGVSLTQASHIVMDGQSSGGAAVNAHLDWLAAQFPQAFVMGVLDASWSPEMTPYLASIPTMDQRARQVYALVKPTADADCRAAHALDPHRCLIASAAFPFVTTPLVVRSSERDWLSLETKGVYAPYDATEQAYIANYSALLKADLQPVPLVFANAGDKHAISEYPGFNKVVIQGIPFRQYLGDQVFQRGGPTQLFGF